MAKVKGGAATLRELLEQSSERDLLIPQNKVDSLEHVLLQLQNSSRHPWPLLAPMAHLH